jgi:putative transposase
LDQFQRGCEVLAVHSDGAAPSGSEGHLYRLCGRVEGFPQAIESVFPQAQVQLCIVHLVRASLNYVNWKDPKQVAADLKPINRAATVGQAGEELDRFMERWGGKYQAIGKLWREQWERVILFFAFPPEIRKVIYTTNAVESLRMSLRKIIKNRGSFPSEDSALKLLYLALRNASVKWETVQHWRQALNTLREAG